MKPESYTLFENGSLDEITNYLSTELKTRNESPFWSDKVIPFSGAILSVLIPLRENKMLFSPQNRAVEKLTPELFFEWSDFVSLKTLAFTLQKSNEEKRLMRTLLEDSTCQRYTKIDLTLLGDYLSRYSINLENESLDFPIVNYNLHQGVSNVIKSLL